MDFERQCVDLTVQVHRDGYGPGLSLEKQVVLCFGKSAYCHAFIIVYSKSPLTHISECFNTALNVGLLSSAEPGAVIDPEGRLEQLDKDGLVRLRGREGSTALLWQ